MKCVEIVLLDPYTSMEFRNSHVWATQEPTMETHRWITHFGSISIMNMLQILENGILRLMTLGMYAQIMLEKMKEAIFA